MSHPSRYHNDQWTLDLKDLGFEQNAQELAQVTLLCEPPFAVVVNGRWGSGKTSLMRYAMTWLGGELPTVRLPFHTKERTDMNHGGHERLEEIREDGMQWLANHDQVPLFFMFDDTFQEKKKETQNEESRVVPIWFSPWRYQNDPNPMVPLLHTMREQLSAWAQRTESLSKVARSVLSAGMDVLGHLADSASSILGFKTKAFSELPKAARAALISEEQKRYDTKTDTERFNLLFEEAIARILGVQVDKNEERNLEEPLPGNHRLIIFIDDLDRCEGATAVKLLEAIKLYLSTKYCVFVLGLDFTAVEHAIETHWEKHPKGLAREYLEKLFQGVHHMPVSHQYPKLIHNYLLRNGLLTPPPDSSEKSEEENVGEEGVVSHPEETYQEEAKELSQAHPVAHSIAAFLEPNPRKVKNFLNTLLISWSVLQERCELSGPTDLLHFAMLQKLRLQAPGTFTYLQQNPMVHLRHLQDFFSACLTGSSVSGKCSPDVTSLFMREFGHVAQTQDERDAGYILGAGEFKVRLEKIAADRNFLMLWQEQQPWQEFQGKVPDGINAACFCRCLGLPNRTFSSHNASI